MARRIPPADAARAAELLGMKPDDLAFALRTGAITKYRLEANQVLRGVRPNNRLAEQLVAAAEACEGQR